MRNNIIFIFIIFIALGCSSKKVSSVYTEGEMLFDKYINYYLQGNNIADIYFIKTVNLFQRNDDLCNLSRIYITKFLLEEERIDKKAIKSALFYADTGECTEEKNLINFLNNQDYNFDYLPEYYRKYITVVREKKYHKLTAYLKGPDYFKSRIFRNIARKISSEDSKLAYELIENAYKIDKFNGWSLNIYRDLLIQKEIKLLSGENTDKIDIRITNLKDILMIKK